MALSVLRAGVLTTVQDIGRRGYQRYGVSVCGAMDLWSLRVANAMVGNASGAAGVEMTLDGPAFDLDEDTLIAVSGADFAPRVGDAPLPMHRPVWIAAGSRIEFGAARMGCRAYLAVAGGIEVPEILGSRSTYLSAGLGGIEGRAVRRGDRLVPGRSVRELYPGLKRQLARARAKFAAAHWAASLHPERLARVPQIIRFVSGRHWETLPADARARYLASEYRLSAASDRMGYRLEGAPLELVAQADAVPEAVAFGTIQLPPDGNPIVLMADRQVTGGYPRLGEVASVDLPLLSQLKPGDRLRFEKIVLSEAQRALHLQEQAFQQLRESVQAHGTE